MRTPKDDGTRYKIVRHFKAGEHLRKTVKSGLTLEQARKHCDNPETCYNTATSERAKAYTAEHGPWFDGYTEE